MISPAVMASLIGAVSSDLMAAIALPILCRRGHLSVSAAAGGALAIRSLHGFDADTARRGPSSYGEAALFDR